ncbi:MAG: (d)CMP kinase [Holophagales bacterium]|nr:(d)CMP kinase [Holophagales bacterium]MYC11198.1 (d)CMP kinase [Holophagales bacterium]
MIVVAIDGPAGVGKSTVARRVATRLGVPYLDTGSMYRAVAWKALEEGLDPADGQAMGRLIAGLHFELRPRNDEAEVVVDGAVPGDRLRTPRVDVATSRVAVHPAVRSWLVAQQREFAAREGAVVEGRDIGTVVFPDTPHKFYLEAPLELRAERRLRQLAGPERGDRSRLLSEMRARDERDIRRRASPLRRDETYELIDTSTGDAEQVADRILRSVRGAATGP